MLREIYYLLKLIFKTLYRRLRSGILNSRIITAKKAVSVDPLSAHHHFDLAKLFYYSGHYTSSVACYRSGFLFLNPGIKQLEGYLASCIRCGKPDVALVALEKYGRDLYSQTEFSTLQDRLRKLVPKKLVSMEHNTYYRLKKLSDNIITSLGTERFSFLDVGGGDGKLSLFLPETDYFIAEPWINGISGSNLPFPDNFFEVSAACHVLEHILPEHREVFIQELCRVSKKYVFLINPFKSNGTDDKNRLEFIFDLTGAEWAKEHREASLPELQDIVDFANKYSYEIDMTPSGNIPLAFTNVIIEYLGKYRPYVTEKINRFFNENMFSYISSEPLPNEFIIRLLIT